MDEYEYWRSEGTGCYERSEGEELVIFCSDELKSLIDRLCCSISASLSMRQSDSDRSTESEINSLVTNDRSNRMSKDGGGELFNSTRHSSAKHALLKFRMRACRDDLIRLFDEIQFE